MWMLKKVEDGSYVAKDGMVTSYTFSIQNAKKWPTKEAAEANKCGNEYAVRLDNEAR